MMMAPPTKAHQRTVVNLDRIIGDALEGERRLTKLGDELVLEDFGLRCTLADLYRGTSLQPRGKR